MPINITKKDIDSAINNLLSKNQDNRDLALEKCCKIALKYQIRTDKLVKIINLMINDAMATKRDFSPITSINEDAEQQELKVVPFYEYLKTELEQIDIHLELPEPKKKKERKS